MGLFDKLVKATSGVDMDDVRAIQDTVPAKTRKEMRRDAGAAVHQAAGYMQQMQNGQIPGMPPAGQWGTPGYPGAMPGYAPGQVPMGVPGNPMAGASYDPNDPWYAPIEGLDIHRFAQMTKRLAQTAPDQQAAVMGQYGLDATGWKRVNDGWVARMGQNPSISIVYNNAYQQA